MEETSRDNRKKKYDCEKIRASLAYKLALRLTPPLTAGALDLVHRTSRWTLVGFDRHWRSFRQHGASLIASWHQDALFTFHFCTRFHPNTNKVTMISYSPDGDIMTRLFDLMNFTGVRGASSGGGREGLHTMRRLVEEQGYSAGFVVDGPHGPSRKVKIGIIALARQSGYPIFPLRTWCRRKIRTTSWDDMIIPLPLNHIRMELGEPISVPRGADNETCERFRLALEERLNEMAAESDRFFGEDTRAK